MKKFFALALMTAMGTTSFANGGDQYNVLLNCESATVQDDASMNLELLSGGLAGLTTIRITRNFNGNSQVNNYIVTQQQVSRKTLVYKGDGISFSVKMTKNPTKRTANLVTEQGQEYLNCPAN